MQIFLNRRAVASLNLSANDQLRLSTAEGTAWVTIDDSPDDFLLSSSSPLEFTGPGRIVIEALDSAMIVRARSRQEHLQKPFLLAAG